MLNQSHEKLMETSSHATIVEEIHWLFKLGVLGIACSLTKANELSCHEMRLDNTSINVLQTQGTGV